MASSGFTLPVPVVRGPLRGAWWLLGSGGKAGRVILGSYEADTLPLFDRQVTPGGTFLDVGAHVGFYTLLASRRVGAGGRVWAFEPSPRNARHLRRHVALNRADNVRIEEAAVAEEDGEGRFGGGSGSGTGRLTDDGRIEVRTVSLDAFCDRHGLTPTAIKVDVEGGEAGVVRGGLDVLRRTRPALFLSAHGPGPHGECAELLGGLGYTPHPIRERGGYAIEALWLAPGG